MINKLTFSWMNGDRFATDDEIELVGVCTDICVVSNALILKAKDPEARFFNQSIISGKGSSVTSTIVVVLGRGPGPCHLQKKLLQSCLLFWRLYALLLGIMRVAGFTCPQVVLWLE